MFKVKNKLTRVLLDETFKDILLNLDVKVRKSDSDILEFNPNFKVMEAFLTYKQEGSTVKDISRKRDAFNVLMSNAKGLEKPKKKKESNGDSINVFRTFFLS